MSFNTLTNDEIPDLGENIEYDLFDDALGFAVRSGAKLNKMRKERGYLKTTYLIDGATGHSQMIDNYRNDMNTDAVKTVNDAFTHVMKKNPELASAGPDVIEQKIMEEIFKTDEAGLVDIATDPKTAEKFSEIAYTSHALTRYVSGGLSFEEKNIPDVIYTNGKTGNYGMSRNKKILLGAGLVGSLLLGAVYAVANYHPQPPVDNSPSINSVNIDKHPELGMASVLVNATDDKAVAGVLVDFNNVNQSMIKLAKDLYGFNITMGTDPANLTVKVYAKDTINQTVLASKDLEWTPRDGFVTSAYLGNHSPKVAGLVYDNLQDIFKYPLTVWPTVDAIYNVIYKNNLLSGYNETDVWLNGIVPAVKYVISLEDSGKINILKVGPQSGNFTLDNLLLQQEIFPKELTMVNMTSGSRNIENSNILIYNVTPNNNLNGTSPQEYMGKIYRNDYTSKGTAYIEAMASAGVNGGGFLPSRVWVNSYESYQKLLSKLISEGEDIPAFIKGWPFYAIIHGIAPQGTEQGSPYVSVLIGREFGYPTVIYTADYPAVNATHSGIHTEPGTWYPKDKSFFTFWCDIEAFIKDYKNSSIKPGLYRSWNSGAERIVG